VVLFDITYSLIDLRSSSRDKIAEQYGLSPATIKRYLRVNKLIQPLKDLLDADRFGIYAAVSLSYLRENEQSLLNDIIGENGNVGIRQAERLRKESESKELSRNDIERILKSKKSGKVKPFKIKGDIVSKYFEGKSEKEIESTILEILEKHFKS